MKTLRFLLGFALTLTAASLLRAETVPATPAPAWKLQDVNGNEVSSAQFKGKVIVVDFWATWCGPCRMEIPGYIELKKKYGKDGLVIIGISCDTDKNAPQTVKNFMKQAGMTYQVVMADEEVQTAFGGMDAIPTTFIIDRAGNIRDRKVGAEPTAEYEKVILKYLK
ncbi:MAG: redoxin family protein [Opitutaceae bacterium]